MPALNKDTGLKECSKCHIEKPANSFSPAATRKDGLTPWCKDCRNFWKQERNRKRNPPAFDPETNTKKCSRCGERKDVSSFGRRSLSKDNLHYWCLPCARDYGKEAQKKQHRKDAQKEYRRKNAACIALYRKTYQATESYKEGQRQHRRNNASRYIEYTENRRAKKLGAVVEGEPLPDVLGLFERDGGECHYCKTVLSFEVQVSRKFVSNSATVEHLLPLTRGGTHTYSNTVLACRSCNSSKHNKTEEEYYEYLKTIEEYKKTHISFDHQ